MTQEAWFQSLKNEIVSLQGNYLLDEMYNKIDKFLEGKYISIDMALELKETAKTFHNETYRPKPDLDAIQEQVMQLIINQL